MTNEIKFKKFGGNIIENITDYIIKYIGKNNGNEKTGNSSNIKISIGCDSFYKSGKYIYAITVVMYNDFENDGAHVVFKRIKVPKYVVVKGMDINQWQYETYDEKKHNVKHIKGSDAGLIYNKLNNESKILLELGLYLDEQLQNKYYRKHSKNDYDGSNPYRLPELHVDYSPTEGNLRHNKSYMLYDAVVGTLCGYGFKVVCKPDAYASSSAADLLCKPKH